MVETQPLGLQQIEPDKIKTNPLNPRLIFNPNTLADLQESIDEVGILVPVILYWDDTENSNILLDGERRLICARNIGLENIPAHVIEKPSDLENIVRMFNIHNVREDWLFMPTAQSLERLAEKYNEDKGKPLTQKQLSQLTGLKVSRISEMLRVLKMPKDYQERIMEWEASTTDQRERKFSHDFFLEMTRSIGSIRKNLPEALEEFETDREVMDQLVKRQEEVGFKSVIEFRDLSRIARIAMESEDPRVTERSIQSITRVIKDPTYSIEVAKYESIAKTEMLEDVKITTTDLIEKLEDLLGEDQEKLEVELIDSLTKLYDTIGLIIRKNEGTN